MYRGNKSAKILISILILCLAAAAFSMQRDRFSSESFFAFSPDRKIWNVDHIVAADKELKGIMDSFIKENIKPDMSTPEKIKAVHDYIILNCAYDYENYISDQLPEDSYSPRGVLINHKAVCEGYAAALKAFMDELDIPCKVVYGTATSSDNRTEGHGWNIVNVDGSWYQIDVTWDDPVPDTPGFVSYQYFLVPDSVMERNHQWTNSEYPACTASCERFISLLGPVCQTGTDIESRLFDSYVNKTAYTIVVPTSFISDYKGLGTYIGNLENRHGIHLPHAVVTQPYGNYNIYTLREPEI